MTEKRGRGRPKGAGAVEPTDLLDTALDAIASSDYSGLSMRAVARLHKVSLATVQHHFGTKQQLWQAAIVHYFDSIMTVRAARPADTLADRIQSALDASGERPGLLASVLGDRSDGYESRLHFVADKFAPMFAEASAELGIEATAGNLRSFDHRALQVLIFVGVGAVAGAPEAVLEMFGYNLDDEGDRSQMAQALADIIGFGIYDARP